MPYKPILSIATNENDRSHYREAFSAFDWTNSGRISYGNLQVRLHNIMKQAENLEIPEMKDGGMIDYKLLGVLL